MIKAIFCSGLIFLGGCGALASSRDYSNDYYYPSPSQEYVVPNQYESDGFGVPVYKVEECVGPVVNGVCHGGVIPDSSWQTKCYGQMVNGECTGPMF